MGWLKGGIDKKALVNLSLHTFFLHFWTNTVTASSHLITVQLHCTETP